MLILVGPSASGKTQVVQKLIQEYGMQKLVTYTSRPMRVGEVDGIDYHFLSKEEFEKRINEGFFIENVNYNGNYYGTSFKGITDDKVVILEPNGLYHYLEAIPSQIKVCVFVCSSEILRLRMINRGDDPKIIEKRLLLDKDVFNNKLREVADYVIDTSFVNLYDCTEKIYKFYNKSLRDKNVED